MISADECRRVRQVSSASQLGLVDPPPPVEIALLALETALAFFVAFFSHEKNSVPKWLAFWGLVFVLIAQWFVVDLCMIIGYATKTGATMLDFLVNVAGPLVKLGLIAMTIIEEWITARYAHSLFNSRRRRIREGAMRPYKRAWILLALTVVAIVLSLMLVSCESSRLFLVGREIFTPGGDPEYTYTGREGRGRTPNSFDAVEIVLLLALPSGLVIIALGFDIYQEWFRIQWGRWRHGNHEATRANLEVTAYAVIGWLLFVIWIIAQGLPNYNKPIYIGVVTTLVLPGMGIVAELYKLAQFGMGPDSLIDG